MTDLLGVFTTVLRALESAGIDYMVVGSVASIIYGEPRMTRDMDVVIEVASRLAPEFHDLFPESEYYCPPVEVLAAEFASRGQFNLLHHESGLKIDIVLRKNTAHAREEFRRRTTVSIGENIEITVATPEDVIIKKLDFYREGGSEKHITDIRGILANTAVDREYLRSWITRLRLEDEWRRVE
ncbi:MAG: hypothetical protein HYY84_17405 [Deltaproteobacteria bacterium]|nr:hypothetical protein [Deltaproteobacteria bacterium]